MRVVAELGIADRQRHQMSDVGEGEIAAVGRGTRDRLHPDRAAGASAGLDEKLLARTSCSEWVSHEPGQGVGSPAGRKVLTMRTGRDGHSSAPRPSTRSTRS